MRVLVTGANGFLGRHVVSALLDRDIEVRAMVRPAACLETLGWPSSVDVFRADLRTSRELVRAFKGVDVLIHLAAVVSGGEEVQFAGTVVGTERLLDAMAASTCRRLVLCSSFSVYDYGAARRVLDEGSPLHDVQDVYARDGYTIAKWWQERVTRRYAGTHGWDLTVLRPGFIWGREHGYLAALGQRFGRHHLVIGPLTRIPMTHVENCAERLCSGGRGRTCVRPDLERRRWPGRTHLAISRRPHPRQQPARLAPSCPLLARHVVGAAGRRHRFQACDESAQHPGPASARVSAQAATLREPQAAGDARLDPASRLRRVPGAYLRSGAEPSASIRRRLLGRLEPSLQCKEAFLEVLVAQIGQDQ